MRLRKTFILLVSFWMLVVVPFGSRAAAEDITKDEAIAIADRLITTNGCTDLMPVKARPHLTDLSIAIKHEVHCQAFAVHEGRPSGRPGWTILYRLAHVCPECSTKNVWRAVTMDERGRHARLERGPFHSQRRGRR